MFTRIVLPLDGSDTACRALPVALKLARDTHAALSLLTVLPTRDPAASGGHETRDDAHFRLRRLATSLNESGIETATALREGNPAQAIVRFTEEVHADLICMATHGRTGLDQLILGSVAEQVVHDASAPVLLVPATCTHFGRHDGPILVPLDGSVHAEAALPLAIGLARLYNAPLTLVGVETPPTPRFDPTLGEYGMSGPEMWAEFTNGEEMTNYLTAIQTRVHRDYPDVRTLHCFGDPIVELMAAVRAASPRCVVAGTRARMFLSRSVPGSVAMAIARTASVPTLLVRTESASRSTLPYTATGAGRD